VGIGRAGAVAKIQDNSSARKTQLVGIMASRAKIFYIVDL